MDSTRTDGRAPLASRARAAIFALGLAGAVAGVVASPLRARAEWDDTDCKREVSPEALGPDPSLQGVRLKANIKVEVIQGDLLVARRNDHVNFRLDAKLFQNGVLDIKGIGEGNNVSVYGWMSKDGRQFNVMNIEKLNDDATLFRDRIAALEKAGDAAELFKLGEKIRAEGAAMRKKDVFEAIAKEAERAAIGIKERSAKPDDAQAWISLCDDYMRLLGDRQGALERLVKAMKPGEQVPPPEVKKRLDQLNAIYYGGEYILFEEMKRKEGFIERNGKWVLRERGDFEASVQNRLRSRTNVRRLLPDYYRQVASNGSTELGMTKEEVSQALGFPDDVDRIRQGNDTFDAWNYEGRGWYYFDGSILYMQPDTPR